MTGVGGGEELALDGGESTVSPNGMLDAILLGRVVGRAGVTSSAAKMLLVGPPGGFFDLQTRDSV